jgi:hypothetical protein
LARPRAASAADTPDAVAAPGEPAGGGGGSACAVSRPGGALLDERSDSGETGSAGDEGDRPRSIGGGVGGAGARRPLGTTGTTPADVTITPGCAADPGGCVVLARRGAVTGGGCVVLALRGGSSTPVGGALRARRGGTGGRRRPHAWHTASSSAFSALQNGQNLTPRSIHQNIERDQAARGISGRTPGSAARSVLDVRDEREPAVRHEMPAMRRSQPTAW